MKTNEMPTGGYQVTAYSVETEKVIKRFDSYVYMCDAMEDFKTWFVKRYGYKPDWTFGWDSLAEEGSLHTYSEKLDFVMERVR